MSIYLNLDSQKFNNVNKIVKIPDVEEIHTTTGKYFGVIYFIYVSSKKDPLIMRLTSKNSSFSILHSIDLLDKRMKPILGIVSDKKIPDNVFIEMINDMILKYLNKNVEENFSLVSNYLHHLNEVEIPIDVIAGFKNAGYQPNAKLSAYGKIIEKLKFAWRTDPGMVIWGGIMMFLLLVTVNMKYRYYFIKLKNWIMEKYVDGPLESKLNRELFVGQEKNEPAYQMYSEVVSFIKQIIYGKSPAFIICGPPGMSKTYILKRTFYFEGIKPGSQYKIEKGSGLGIKDVYSMLYYNRKKILVLDDFDTPLQNPEMVNMLKAITDSYDRRILSMPREKDLSHADSGGASPAAPSKFEFKGKLIIITNLTRNKIDGALISRCPVYEMKFNSVQIIKSLNELMQFINPSVSIEIKQEVFDYIMELYKKDPKIEVNFRSFKNSIDARIGNPMYWKQMVNHIVNYKNK